MRYLIIIAQAAATVATLIGLVTLGGCDLTTPSGEITWALPSLQIAPPAAAKPTPAVATPAATAPTPAVASAPVPAAPSPVVAPATPAAPVPAVAPAAPAARRTHDRKGRLLRWTRCDGNGELEHATWKPCKGAKPAAGKRAKH
jgi:hypothetical protein